MFSSGSRASVQFDLSKITAFNPALIYGFNPEDSMVYPQGSAENTILAFSQLNDMFDAYYYAQEEILPAIVAQGIQHLRPDQVIEWLNQIHKRIANAQAQDQASLTQAKAGEFTQAQVIRWQHGYELEKPVFKILANRLPRTVTVEEIARKMGIEKNLFINFIDLLRRVGDDNSIIVPADQAQFLPANAKYHTQLKTLQKLAVLVHQKRLSREESQVIGAFVKFAPAPLTIPQRMQQFVMQLLGYWQTCQADDLDQVARLASFTFYMLTEEHPWFNGNGRTATCFMNIILRSLGKPSILIRNPEERNAPESSYSVAIREINTRPALFLQHIKNRLNEAPYVDETLAEITSKRIVIRNLLLAILKKSPGADLNQLLDQVQSLAQETEEFQQCEFDDLEKAPIAIRNKIVLASVDVTIDRLTQVFYSSSINRHSFTANEMQVKYDKLGVDELTRITGYPEWLPYKSKGQQVFFLNIADNVKRHAMITQLNALDVLIAKSKRIITTGVSVIEVSHVDFAKLSGAAAFADPDQEMKLAM